MHPETIRGIETDGREMGPLATQNFIDIGRYTELSQEELRELCHCNHYRGYHLWINKANVVIPEITVCGICSSKLQLGLQDSACNGFHKEFVE